MALVGYNNYCLPRHAKRVGEEEAIKHFFDIFERIGEASSLVSLNAVFERGNSWTIFFVI